MDLDMFLKNYSIQTKLVKTSKTPNNTPVTEEHILVTPEQIEEIANRFVKNAAVTIGLVVVAVKAFDVLGSIIVKKI